MSCININKKSWKGNGFAAGFCQCDVCWRSVQTRERESERRRFVCGALCLVATVFDVFLLFSTNSTRRASRVRRTEVTTTFLSKEAMDDQRQQPKPKRTGFLRFGEFIDLERLLLLKAYHPPLIIILEVGRSFLAGCVAINCRQSPE
jgi:hypothetical protein